MVRGLLTKKQHVWLIVWNWIVILGDKNEYLGDNIVLIFSDHIRMLVDVLNNYFPFAYL